MWDRIRDWWDDNRRELLIGIIGIVAIVVILTFAMIVVDEQNKILPESTPVEPGKQFVLRYQSYPIRVYEDIKTGGRYLLSDRGGIVRLVKPESEDDR